MRLKFAILAAVAMLGMARGAYAQGCALCYTSASALGASGERSLDIGILTLLTPALVLFLVVMFMLYRRATAATVQS
ncbi:MAG: hypothetical protein LAO08_15655 [Acidobacteriia bacterium]|nr:hypothetical protein [Terriglobia bacterium]